MSMTLETGVGVVTASERYAVMRPKNRTAVKRGILYVHGRESGTTSGAVAWQAYVERTTLFLRLAAAGFVVLSCDAGGNATWGNNTAISRLTDAKTYLLTLGVSPTKIATLATSMGNLNALAWIAANLSLITCHVGIIPVCDLTDMRTNNRGGFQSEIDTAYGGTYSEASLGATHNPQTIAAAGGYGSLPIQLWYGSTDTTAPGAQSTALKSAVGASCSATSMVGGHSEAIVANVDVNAVIAFINAAG